MSRSAGDTTPPRKKYLYDVKGKQTDTLLQWKIYQWNKFAMNGMDFDEWTSMNNDSKNLMIKW